MSKKKYQGMNVAEPGSDRTVVHFNGKLHEIPNSRPTLKGYVVSYRHQDFRDFCHDARLDYREYCNINNLERLYGISRGHGLPVYIVAIHRSDASQEFIDMIFHPLYDEFLRGARVILRPTRDAKWS